MQPIGQGISTLCLDKETLDWPVLMVFKIFFMYIILSQEILYIPVISISRYMHYYTAL